MRSRTLHTGPKPPDTTRRLASAAPVGQIAASRHHARARPRLPAAMSAPAPATSARTTTEKTAVSENGTVILAPMRLGLVFTPLQVLSFATLAPSLRTEGAALFSLGRNIGAAIGVSVTTSLLAHNAQALH